MKLCTLFVFIISLSLFVLYSEQEDFPAQDQSQYSTRQPADKPAVVAKPHIYAIKAVRRARLVSRQTAKVEAERKIVEYTAILATSADAEERMYAIIQLQQMGGRTAVSGIAKGLGDKNLDVRTQVITSLAVMEGKETAYLFGQVLFSSAEQEFKLQTLDAMAENISPAGIALLTHIAHYAESEQVQNRAMDIIESHAGSTEIQVMSESEPQKDYYAMQQQALFLPPEELVSSLQYVLKKSPDADLREDAIISLATSDQQAATNVIADALRADKSSYVRLQAMQALTHSNHEIMPVMGQVLFADPDPALRIAAIHFMAAAENPAGRAFLEQALNDPDATVRAVVEKYLH